MCGIFALSSTTDTVGNRVLEGLKKLEYRGYDSWGVAMRDTDTGDINTQKQIGKISEVSLSLPATHEAIGHTRWATHGGITVGNTHPHTIGDITLVHNGVVENFQEIRENLDFTPKSETDTEILTALINAEFSRDRDVLRTLARAIPQIKGRFSIVFLVKGISGIFGVRRGSPLIVGRGKGETFIASDIPAFLEYTSEVNYIDDNECVHVEKDVAHFFSAVDGSPHEKRLIKVPWKHTKTERGNYPHFMIKEIFEQKKSLMCAFDQEKEALDKAVKILKETVGSYFIGCGTAHKMCMGGEYFFAKIAQRKINVVPASEVTSFYSFIKPSTAIVAVSQSGETADVMEVVEEGLKRGARIIAITNVSSSSLARSAEVVLPLNVGIEKAVASTKASSAMLAVQFLLAHADAQTIPLAQEAMHRIVGNINDFLNPRYEDHVARMANIIKDSEKLFILGHHDLYPIALESSIKIQEVSYIHAQGFASGELKHGPLALIEKGTWCIILGSDPETISSTIELRSRGAKTLGISSENNPAFDHWIRVPECSDLMSILCLIPIQILSYHLSVLRGNNPDLPRNLAKSVTVK